MPEAHGHLPAGHDYPHEVEEAMQRSDYQPDEVDVPKPPHPPKEGEGKPWRGGNW